MERSVKAWKRRRDDHDGPWLTFNPRGPTIEHSLANCADVSFIAGRARVPCQAHDVAGLWQGTTRRFEMALAAFRPVVRLRDYSAVAITTIAPTAWPWRSTAWRSSASTTAPARLVSAGDCPPSEGTHVRLERCEPRSRGGV
jgi:hypothetical protein